MSKQVFNLSNIITQSHPFLILYFFNFDLYTLNTLDWTTKMDNDKIPPLGKYLASNEKRERDKVRLLTIPSLSKWFPQAIRNLRNFLTSKNSNLDDLESAKLWRGIFYCKLKSYTSYSLSYHIIGFWMSDKPLVQQKLAWDLSNILLEIPDVDNCWNFYKGFWDELIREWSGLDRYRLVGYI